MPTKINSLCYVGRAFKRCARPRHLRRTSTIAFVVGSWLTLFNQGGVLAAGHVDPALLLKVLLNYLTPFVVANFGLLSAQKTDETPEGARSGNPRPSHKGKSR